MSLQSQGSAQGLTAARRLVANGADKARAAVLTRRMDAAKMPIYLVALYRWKVGAQTMHIRKHALHMSTTGQGRTVLTDAHGLTQQPDDLTHFNTKLPTRQEFKAFAAKTGQPWPLDEETLAEAYAEWLRVFTTLGMSFVSLQTTISISLCLSISTCVCLSGLAFRLVLLMSCSNNTTTQIGSGSFERLLRFDERILQVDLQSDVRLKKGSGSEDTIPQAEEAEEDF